MLPLFASLSALMCLSALLCWPTGASSSSFFSAPPSPPASPFPPALSVQTERGWVGNSVGPGHSDSVFGQVLSAPNNYAAATLDPLTGELYTNCEWEESAEEMSLIAADGRYTGRMEEAHGWSRTGGLTVVVTAGLALFSGVQGFIDSQYPYPQYPQQGQSYWGFFVANKSSMLPQSVPGGASFENMLLVTSTTGTASAAAVDETGVLWVAHPTDGALQQWNLTSWQLQRTVRGAANWSSLAFAGTDPQRLWGVLDGAVYQVDSSTGQPSVEVAPLPNIERAMSVAVSHASPTHLVVADGGLHTQQVLVWDVSVSPPVLNATVGESGGVWGPQRPGGPPRGHRGALRFEWLTAAGQRSDGSIVVVCASNSVWRGSEMQASVKSFKRQKGRWQLQWELEGNSWVDAGSFDPQSPQYLYLPNCVYEVSLPLSSSRPSGRCIASTTDVLSYPEDPRLHQDNFSFQCARLLYIAGRRFLQLTSMYGGIVALFRYEDGGFTAIPSALLLLQGPYTDQRQGEQWPPGQPSTAYTWRDANCNGRFEQDEYSAAPSLVSAWSTFIDSNGSLWAAHETGVERTALTGLDSCGNPIYSRGAASTNWSTPPDFSFIERVQYDAALDRLLLTGWDTHSAAGHGLMWGTAGNLLAFYDGWAGKNATLRAKTALHSEWNSTEYPQGPVIKTVSWVHELIFLVEGFSATVTVMEAASLQNLTAVLFNPDPNSDWHNGWIDVPDALHAIHVASTNSYLVALEDDYCAKTALLSVRVLPDNDTLCARLALEVAGNSSGAGEVALLSLLVTTLWLGTPDTRHGANVYGLANPLSPLIPLLRGDVQYRADNSTAPDYLNDTRSQAELAAKWVAFFGAALGCRATDFPRYSLASTQHAVHRGMAISARQFDYFNQQVVLALQYWGVEAGGRDMQAVEGFLAQFGSSGGDNAICTAPDCEHSEKWEVAQPD